MALGAVGLSIGLIGALMLTRTLQHVLRGVSSADPLTFAGAVLVLATSAFIACAIRQASAI